MEETLHVDRRAGLLRISINRPPLNILDLTTIQALTAALRRARNDGQTRLIILTSEGERAFSAGVDVRDHLPGKDAEMIAAVQDQYRARSEEHTSELQSRFD